MAEQFWRLRRIFQAGWVVLGSSAVPSGRGPGPYLPDLRGDKANFLGACRQIGTWYASTELHSLSGNPGQTGFRRQVALKPEARRGRTVACVTFPWVSRDAVNLPEPVVRVRP